MKTPEGSYQLIEGYLIKEPSPNTYHQRISRKIEFIITKFATENDLGEVFFAPYDVVVDNETVVQPDILFVSKENQRIITKENIKGPPDLVIEIISPSSAYRDLVKKKKIYAAFGVKEYWIVDPEEKTVDVYGLENNEYNLAGSYNETDELTSRVIKGLTINLRELFKQDI